MKEILGLRKTSIHDESNVKPVEFSYSKDAPGTSKRIERAYMECTTNDTSLCRWATPQLQERITSV